jgi:hypothetical protein
MTVASLICQIGLCVVFATAGIGKLRRPDAISELSTAFPFLSPAQWRAIAWVELLVAVALPLPWTGRIAGVVAAGLLLAFCTGIALVLYRGDQVPCRCFGSTGTVLGRRHLVRNAVLLAAAVFAVAVPVVGGLEPAAIGFAMVAGGIGGTLVIASDTLVA